MGDAGAGRATRAAQRALLEGGFCSDVVLRVARGGWSAPAGAARASRWPPPTSEEPTDGGEGGALDADTRAALDELFARDAWPLHKLQLALNGDSEYFRTAFQGERWSESSGEVALPADVPGGREGVWLCIMHCYQYDAVAEARSKGLLLHLLAAAEYLQFANGEHTLVRCAQAAVREELGAHGAEGAAAALLASMQPEAFGAKVDGDVDAVEACCVNLAESLVELGGTDKEIAVRGVVEIIKDLPTDLWREVLDADAMAVATPEAVGTRANLACSLLAARVDLVRDANAADLQYFVEVIRAVEDSDDLCWDVEDAKYIAAIGVAMARRGSTADAKLVEVHLRVGDDVRVSVRTADAEHNVEMACSMLSANLELLVEDCEAFHLLTALPVALLARLAPKVADLDLAASAASFAVDQLLYRAQEEDTSAHPTALDILATCQAYDLGALTPQGHESLFDLVDVAARKLSAAGRPGPAAAELGAKLGALVQFELLSDDAIERALQTPLLPAANIVRSLLRGRRQSNFEGESKIAKERTNLLRENKMLIERIGKLERENTALRAKGGRRTPRVRSSYNGARFYQY